MPIKHALTSTKSEGADATKVRTSNWNADHIGTLDYSSTLIDDAGGSATTVAEALDFILAALVSSSIIASIIDRWFDEAGTTMQNGTTMAGVTRQTGTAPDSHTPYISVSTAHQNPICSISGLTEGTQVRVSAKAWAPSGGGTALTIRANSTDTVLRNDQNPGTVTSVTQTVTVGSDGLLQLKASWNPAFYDLLIENLGL